MIIQFTIPIEPVAKGRPRFGYDGRCRTPEKTKEYEERIQELLGPHRKHFKEIMDCPLSVALRFFLLKPQSSKRIYPSVRPDLDNYAKAVLDAMNGIVFNDDGQIVQLTLSKAYHPGKPCIEVYIESRQEV